MCKKMNTFLWLVFGLGLLLSLGTPTQSSSAATQPSNKSSNDFVAQGCLGKTSGQFILMQTDPSTTYKLESGTRKIKLDRHLGQKVEVTGWESPSLSTSSEHLSKSSASSVTIMVTLIRTLEKHCTH